MGARLGAAVLGGLAALAAMSPAAAREFSSLPPGFAAEQVGEFNVSCGGAGPSGTATDGTVHYWAIDGELELKKPREDQRRVEADPFGLALASGGLYATQPGCTDRPPGLGAPCNVVRLNPATGGVTPVAEVCGTAIAASPDGGRLAVATADEIVTMTTAGVVQQRIPGVARSLAWMSSTIYFVRPDGGVSSTTRPLTGPIRARAIAPGTAALGLEDHLVVSTDTGLSIVPVGGGAPKEIATAPDMGQAVATSGNVILVAKLPDAWALRGRYTPAGPPAPAPAGVAPPPPPTQTPRAAPPRADTISPVPRAPAPPPVPPPPAAPPAPPAPPAPLPVFVAQPSAVANPAMVPGQHDPEAAYRLAATRAPRSLAPTLIWLALATAGGMAAFVTGTQSGRRRFAHAEVRV